MKTTLSRLLLATFLAAGAGHTYAADSEGQENLTREQLLAMGEKLALVCQACHGLGNEGKNATPYVPRIVGQHAEYTIAQIEHYRNGERRGGMAAHMKIAADVLTEEQMKAVALYLESLWED